MTDEKKPFTVTDRRLFTSDGERRASAEPDPPEREPAPGGPRPQAAPPPRQAVPSTGPAVDFASFLVGLAAQAGMLLGREGQAATDLAGVREVIGILEMLRDKTEGRRTAEEEEILDGILYELRMAYLHKSGGGGA